MKRVFSGIFILSVICFNSGCEFNSPVYFIADNAKCQVWGETSSKNVFDRCVTFDDNFLQCSPNTEFELWISKERLTIKSKDRQYQNNFKLSYNREETYTHKSLVSGTKRYYFEAQSECYSKYKSEVIIEYDTTQTISIRCITYFDSEMIKKIEDEVKDYLKGKKLKEIKIDEEYVKANNENVYNKMVHMLNQL